MIVILGGGISGLLASFAVRMAGKEAVLLESQPVLGGNFTVGGLKYIRQTRTVRDMLATLCIPYTAYRPMGALLWNGVPRPHPQWVLEQPPELIVKIQLQHWIKTRGTSNGYNVTCMNDPGGDGDVVALKCDHGLLLLEMDLQTRAAVHKFTHAKVHHIDEHNVRYRVGDSDHVLKYDRLITTLPMGVMSHVAPHLNLPAPPAHPTKLLVATITADPIEYACNYLTVDGKPWDYMYTPDVRLMSRITRISDLSFSAEFPFPEYSRESTPVDDVELLQRMFGDYTVQVQRWIPGHIRPLERAINWPSNWLALGRYAQWDPRATTEKSLDRVLEWI